MKCKHCHEDGVYQSFSEVDGGYVIQATCIVCGSGWCDGTVTLAQGLALLTAKEDQERKDAVKRADKEKEDAKPKPPKPKKDE